MIKIIAGNSLLTQLRVGFHSEMEIMSFKVFLRVLERDSLNPPDLLVLERKRVSAIKEKSLTPVKFELTTSGSDHPLSHRLGYEANRELVVEI